jgi:putative tryptophan/tyrosine transport system substrate-binding protein
MRRRELLLIAAAMMTTRPVRAQQKAMPVIGFLGVGVPGPFAPVVAAFRQGLKEAGWVEGQDVAIEYRWAELRYDRLPALAADLVGRKVDVIVTSGGISSAKAARDVTSTIPIVFAGADNPVGTGLVASLSRPGGNLTGFSVFAPDLMTKRLELLSELVPQARVFGLLVDPNNQNTQRVIADAEDAARAKGVQLDILKASSDSGINDAFENLASLHVDALIVNGFFSLREHIVQLAARYAAPAMYDWREWVEAGGLISYGARLATVYRLAGIYVGKILDGAKPADLPVQQPTTFELVVNHKTAGALGLTIPPLDPRPGRRDDRMRLAGAHLGLGTRPSSAMLAPCVAASASPPMSARSSWSSRSHRTGQRPTSRRAGTPRRLTCSRWSGTIGGLESAAWIFCAGV